MKTDLVFAADVSVWSGQISEARWKAAKDNHGIGLAIVGAWHGGQSNWHCASTLHTAKAAGLNVATYAVLNQLSGAESVAHARDACGPFWKSLKFVALDIEVRGVTEDAIDEATRTVAADGLQPIIYTGAWFWRGRLGNPDWAADLPLWDSRYDGKQDLAFPDPYGPWASVVGKQYEGSNGDLGFSSDLSVFDRCWLT